MAEVAKVPVRALNQDTAGVLARVEGGEVVEITSRGKPIARIIPITRSNELDDLVAAGRVTPATDHSPFTMPPGPVDHTNAASNALIAMRDEERW
jgi:prevent-host-death family protein